MYYFVREISLDYILDAASLWMAWKLPILNSPSISEFSHATSYSDRGNVAMTVVTMSRYFNFLLQYFRDILSKNFWVIFLACVRCYS